MTNHYNITLSTNNLLQKQVLEVIMLILFNRTEYSFARNDLLDLFDKILWISEGFDLFTKQVVYRANNIHEILLA